MLSSLQSGVLARVNAGLTEWFNQRRDSKSTTTKKRNPAKEGQVFIVGAGPGDPELLTIKALNAIQQADVLLIDWLVGEALYEYFPAHVERIFVGKRCGQHSMSQKEINALMVQKALAGNNVVRLKGGDASIFGRLAEECDALTEHNIPFAVVPGVTAASGCAAYSGIPLTHRDCAQSVKFVTAHVKQGGVQANWEKLANDPSTLVFYMGLSRVGQICDSLQAHGMRSSMPIAIIDQGTTKQQKVLCSTLKRGNDDLAKAGFTGPALIVVGEVVDRRQAVSLSMLYAKT